MVNPTTRPEPGATATVEPDIVTAVARARDGDQPAFEELVMAHQRPIYHLALRMTRNRDDAQDITQEVFLTAWRQLDTLSEAAAFGAWLYRIATRRCLNLLARTPRTGDLEGVHLISTDPAGDPERMSIAEGHQAALEEAIGRLPAAQRAVWLLREVHGCTYEQIAAAVGAAPAAVRGRLARARVGLAQEMAPWR